MAIKIIALIFFCLSSLVPARSFAASLSLTASPAVVRPGDVVEVTLSLDTDDLPVNALEGEVSIPQGFSFVSTKEDSSFVSIWLERPRFEKGTVRFSGVIPGGYNGEIGPYWVGKRPGEVFSLVLRAVGTDAVVSASLTRLLAHDGKGTAVAVSPTKLRLSVSDRAPESLHGSITDDLVPPEPFDIELGIIDTSGKAKRFVAFNSYDKGSGIAFYSVQEEGGEFVSAESPYVLLDQGARNVVVRAYDKAGNIREESMGEDAYPQTEGSLRIVFWATLIALASCVGLYIIFSRIGRYSRS
jgi:hypothetical protein